MRFVRSLALKNGEKLLLLLREKLVLFLVAKCWLRGLNLGGNLGFLKLEEFWWLKFEDPCLLVYKAKFPVFGVRVWCCWLWRRTSWLSNSAWKLAKVMARSWTWKENATTNELYIGFKPLIAKEMRSSSLTSFPTAESWSAHCLAVLRYLEQDLLPCYKFCNCHLSWEMWDLDWEAYLSARDFQAWCDVFKLHIEATKGGGREQMI